MDIKKIFSIICLLIAFIAIFPFIYHHTTSKNEEASKWSLWFIIIFLIISVILSLSQKGSDITLEDLICLLMILLALILTYLARSNNWGFKTSLMSLFISVLGAIQLIIGANNLNKKI